MTLVHRRARLLLGALPVTLAAHLVACSDDGDGAPLVVADDARANLPEAAAPIEDAGVADVRAPVDVADEPIVCTAKPCVTQLVGGGSHFCALLDDKTVRCWGYAFRAFGVVDAGSDGAYASPIPMGLTDVEELSAAVSTTCARHADGRISCWGGNGGNELGLDPPRSDYGPHDAAFVAADDGALSGFASVHLGVSAVFATRADGSLWSWGDNSEGALGRMREPADYLGPGPVTELAGQRIRRAGGTSVRGSYSIAYAVDDAGRLLMWGTHRQTIENPGPAPLPVDGLENVSSVSVLSENICAVADGKLYCWGRMGQRACLGTTDPALSPVHVRTHGEAPAQQVAVLNHTCVRLTDGTIECCGSDSKGELGQGIVDGGAEAAPSYVLTEAKAFSGHAVKVVLGLATTCALVQGGTVECWGGNEYGELGQGTRDRDPHPIPAEVIFE